MQKSSLLLLGLFACNLLCTSVKCNNAIANQSPETNLVNFAELAQDFVLETKQINIPGFSGAFNPSILCYGNELLLTFRTRDPITGSTNAIGFVWLNGEFEAISEPQFYHPERSDCTSYAQDTRILAVGEKLYLVYSNLLANSNPNIPLIRRMFYSTIRIKEREIEVDPPFYITDYDGETTRRQEKNWEPFDYKGNLLLAYMIEPHHVVYPTHDETSSCESVAITTSDLLWDLGELRGGTPALLNGDQYLSFFHSTLKLRSEQSAGKKMSHYFMGAYTFSSEPPFGLTAISPGPILGEDFYVGPEYPTWEPLRVVFPCGYFANEDYIWVTYGKQDFEAWVVKMDKKKLLESLVPVTSKSLLNKTHTLRV